VGVDPALLRGLKQWSAKKTFTYQFRVAATAAPVPPPRQPVFAPQKPAQLAPAGLAAIKYGQAMQQARSAAIGESFARQSASAQHGRPGSAQSSFGELYLYYKRMGMLEVFFSLFPG